MTSPACKHYSSLRNEFHLSDTNICWNWHRSLPGGCRSVMGPVPQLLWMNLSGIRLWQYSLVTPL